MNVGKIDNSQSFQALNFNNVSIADRVFIRKDFKKLQELGEKYNIRLTSTYAGVPNYSAIDIDVKPLSKDLSFFRKLFPPTGQSTFVIPENVVSVKTSVLDSVNDAIKNLITKIG